MNFKKWILAAILILFHSIAWAGVPPIPEIPKFPLIQSNGNIYHVNKDIGNDANNGSSVSPWKTIQYGVNRLSAGDTLIIHAGATAYNEEVDISAAGTSNNWITIKGADGETVEIGSQKRAIDAQATAEYIYLKNLKLTGTTHTGLCLRQGSQHFAVEDIEIDGQNTMAYGSWIGDLNDWTGVQHCYFRNVEAHHCTVYGVVLNNGDEDLTFDNCIFRDNGVDGIAGRANPSESTPVVDVYVVNCEAYNNGEEGFDLGSNNNSIFKNCIAHNNGMEGFKVWGGIADGDDIWLVNCLAYDNGRTGITIKNISDADVYILNCTLVSNQDNTIIAKMYNSGSGGFNMGLMHLHLYNSIIMPISGKKGISFEHTNAEVKEENNNYFFGPTENTTAIQLRDNQVIYATYFMSDIGAGKAWTAATGKGANSFARTTASDNLANPGFVDLNKDNYSLNKSSLAVNAGADVGVTTDITGKQRTIGHTDIGAYEYQEDANVALESPSNLRVL